jgi:hypothetical protein
MTIATTIRLAEVADADAVGRLLYDFNTEFDEPTPGPQAAAERVRRLLADDELTVVIADADAYAGPEGLAVLRFRPSLLKATFRGALRRYRSSRQGNWSGADGRCDRSRPAPGCSRDAPRH